MFSGHSSHTTAALDPYPSIQDPPGAKKTANLDQGNENYGPNFVTCAKLWIGKNTEASMWAKKEPEKRGKAQQVPGPAPFPPPVQMAPTTNTAAEPSTKKCVKIRKFLVVIQGSTTY